MWLKRQQPIQLYQSSDIPYIILENGIYLCFDNCYGIKKDKSDFNIEFSSETFFLKRINTHFYKFDSFPITIPFQNVTFLNQVKTENQSEISDDSKNIAIIESDYIRKMPDNNLVMFSDKIDQFDSSFILINENIEPQIRFFEDVSQILPHSDWNRTLIFILHNTFKQQDRKYCWTKHIPELSISCYGIKNSDELEHINNILISIGINDISVTWVD